MVKCWNDLPELKMLTEVTTSKAAKRYMFSLNLIELAYENSNLPILDLLRSEGIDVLRIEYLPYVVRSKNVETVKTFMNDYHHHQSMKLKLDAESEKEIKRSLIIAAQFSTLEIFFTIVEITNVKINDFPNLIYAGRIELLPYIYNIKENFDRKRRYIMELLLHCRYCNVEYLSEVFKRFPSFQRYIEDHISEIVLEIFVRFSHSLIFNLYINNNCLFKLK